MTDITDLVIDHPAEPDTRHAPAETVAVLGTFVAAKSSHGVADTMAHFSPEVVTLGEDPQPAFPLVRGLSSLRGRCRVRTCVGNAV